MRWLSVILGILVATSSATACYNDIDTNLTELRDNLDVTKAIIGRFTIYPDAYYEKRIEIQSAILKKNPNNLDAYDNISVAYDRIGDGENALKWIHEKRKHLGHNPGSHLYSTEANEGTFLIVRWIRGHKPGDLTDAIEAEKHIAKALEINPNAHFGREFAQLYCIQAMIECGKEPDWMQKFSGTLISIADRKHVDHKKLRFGIAGMMVLGAAWEMPPMIKAIAELVPQENQIMNLCEERLTDDKGRSEYKLIAHDSVNPKERELLNELMENGTKFRENRQQWIFTQLNKGSHPDTDPDFWKGFTDVPEIPKSEFVVKRKKTDYSSLNRLISTLVATVSILAVSGICAFYYFRRRRLKGSGL
ncbi:MAG: hypothetical protein WCG75_01455 [Armatimonadota bacterium]